MSVAAVSVMLYLLCILSCRNDVGWGATISIRNGQYLHSWCTLAAELVAPFGRLSASQTVAIRFKICPVDADRVAPLGGWRESDASFCYF